VQQLAREAGATVEDEEANVVFGGGLMGASEQAGDEDGSGPVGKGPTGYEQGGTLRLRDVE
jgi:hypothetical protein